MRNTVAIFTTLLLLFELFSCKEKKGNTEKLSAESVEVGNRFYNLLKSKNYDSLPMLFSSAFYEKFSRDELRDFLSDIRNTNGFPKEVELVETKNSIEINGTRKEHIFTNAYRVIYSSGFIAREELSFVIRDTTTVFNKVDGYQFDYFYPPKDSGNVSDW